MESILKDKNQNMIIKASKTDIDKTMNFQASTSNENDTEERETKTKKNSMSYEKMTIKAIAALKERNGASLSNIKKYLISEFSIPSEKSIYILRSLKKSVKDGVLVRQNNQRFKLSPETIKKIKNEMKQKTKKPKKDKENIEPKKDTKTKKKDKTGKKADKKSKKVSTKAKQINNNIDSKKKAATKKTKKLEDNEANEHIAAKKKKKNESATTGKKAKTELSTGKSKIQAAKSRKSIGVIASEKLVKKARKSLVKMSFKKLNDTKIKKDSNQNSPDTNESS